MNGQTTKCNVCGGEVAKGAKACPGCGKKSRNFIQNHKIISTIAMLILLGGIGGVLGNGDSNGDSNASSVPGGNQASAYAASQQEAAPVPDIARHCL